MCSIGGFSFSVLDTSEPSPMECRQQEEQCQLGLQSESDRFKYGEMTLIRFLRRFSI